MSTVIRKLRDRLGNIVYPLVNSSCFGDSALDVTHGGTGATTVSGARNNLDADQRLKLASSWTEAVTNAKSEIVVCVYDSTNVYSVTIPRAEITATTKTFFQGGAYAQNSLNHVQVAVSTTAITAGWYFNGSHRSSSYRAYYR